MNKDFTCDCKNGETNVINEATVEHKCGFRPSSAYMLGEWITYERIQVSMVLTKGVEKYNWFAR